MGDKSPKQKNKKAQQKQTKVDDKGRSKAAAEAARAVIKPLKK